MTSNLLKREVLKTFKNLHRTSCSIFQNNVAVLETARQEINSAFKKNKHVTDVESIKELIKLGNDAIIELKTSVVELEEIGPGKFRMKLRPEMFEDYNKVPEKNVPN